MPPDAPSDSWLLPLRGLLRERLGHELPEDRVRGEIAAFARARAAAVGVEDPAAWVDLLAGSAGAEEWRRLVRAATVGETYFFRHPEQLRAIAAFARTLRDRRSGPLLAWSAGCATGEEPWSLAILLAEAGIPAEVLATDVNDLSLERARAASGYGDRSARHMPEDLRERWLERGGSGFRVRRAGDLGVRFALHNLARDPVPRSAAPDGRFDVVLCRNVLIYFPPDLARSAVLRLLGAVAPGGGLWLGPADGVPHDLLRTHRDEIAGERFLRPEPQPPPTPSLPTASPPPAGRRPPVPAPPEPDVLRLIDRGLVAAAEELLEQRVSRAPEDGEAHLLLAALALARHDFDSTLSRIRRAAGATPCPPGCDYLRGVALLRSGRREEAADAFLDALEADPDDWAASLHLALHYRRKARPLQEEVMLEHARLRLEGEPGRPPDHGPAAGLVDSVHRDPAAALRAVRARLAELSPEGVGGPPGRGAPDGPTLRRPS